MSELMKKISY